MNSKSNKKEFSRLISNNQAIIHKISSFYTDCMEDKEDLFQEICLQLWRSYPSFNDQSKFSTWMYKVAINTAISHVRRCKKSLKFEDLKKDVSEVNDTESAQQSKLLYKAITELDKVDRAVIILWLDGKKYEEISEILGLSKSNVSVKLVRIKEKLSGKLNPKNVK
ncbi:MAG: hypothetical protein C0592_07945 [Marinilabiliales bacterium]|nr:MAG: hypothetical protein C0592_07945 [Marinilabiliales bacterium]